MSIQPSYLDRIRRKYNEIGDVWDKTDRWHAWSKRQIEDEMFAVAQQFKMGGENRLIVDVGSGGHSYFDSNSTRIEVDIAEARLHE